MTGQQHMAAAAHCTAVCHVSTSLNTSLHSSRGYVLGSNFKLMSYRLLQLCTVACWCLRLYWASQLLISLCRVYMLRCGCFTKLPCRACCSLPGDGHQECEAWQPEGLQLTNRSLRARPALLECGHQGRHCTALRNTGTWVPCTCQGPTSWVVCLAVWPFTFLGVRPSSSISQLQPSIWPGMC